MLEVAGRIPERRELSRESSRNLCMRPLCLRMNYKLCMSRMRLDGAKQRPTIREIITTREL